MRRSRFATALMSSLAILTFAACGGGYLLSSSEWTSLPDLPGPRKGAVAAAWNDSIIVTTGSPTGTDPDGTTWIGCCMK